MIMYYNNDQYGQIQKCRKQDFHKTLNLMKFHFNDSDSRQ